MGDLDDLFRAYLNLSDVLGGPLNRLEESLQLALDGVERSRRVGMAGDYGVSLQCNAAAALVELGRFAEAAEVLSAAERRNPSEMAAIDLHRCWARLQVCRGSFDDAVAQLGAARQLMAKTVDPPYHVPLHAIEAELALWQGRPVDARGAVADGLRQLEGLDDPWLAVPLLWVGLWAEAECALRVGRRASEERARAEESSAERIARSRTMLRLAASVAPSTHAYAALCEAENDRRDRSDGHGAWARAAHAWESAGHPYPQAYAQWRHAEALFAARRAREGAAALIRAGELAARIGAEPLAREIAMLARRARVDLPVDAPDTPDGTAANGTVETGLTRRQREVLALIAAGMTNREIAQRLFITEKTAGAHVSSILAALGVRTRVEAATTAHRLGLVPPG